MHKVILDGLLNKAKIQGYDKGYRNGIIDAIEGLREVYGEGIEETDLWAEYMKEGE